MAKKPSKQEVRARIEQIKEMRKASLDMRGKPLPGYAGRVEAIDAELVKLEGDA